MPPETVDWTPGLLALVLGLLGGTLLMWRLYAAGGASPATATEPPLELRDLAARRDALLVQLRELEDTAAKRNPEQLALERYALELDAARVLRDLETRGAKRAKSAPSAAEAQAAPAPGTAPATSGAASRGFLWGMASTAAVALLLVLVSRSATQRPEGATLTGTIPGSQAETTAATPDPELAQLQQALQRNPDDLEARLELARMHLERQELMEVFNQSRYVLEREPKNARALSYQALVRLAMGQADVAESLLKQAIGAEPDFLEAYVDLVLVYVRTGRMRDAEAFLRKAKSRSPERAATLDSLYQRMQADLAGEPPAAPAEDPRATAPAATAGDGVAGTVEIDPAAAGRLKPGAMLFVLVRAQGVAAGPPVAVRRMPAGGFPLGFRLGPQDSMLGQAFPARLRVEARVDSDGDPLTRDPADPSAAVDGVSLGTTNVKLQLRR